MTLTNRSAMSGSAMCGPIAEGETPEQAVERMSKLFNRKVEHYDYLLHNAPVKGDLDKQQFPVIVGTVWAW